MAAPLSESTLRVPLPLATRMWLRPSMPSASGLEIPPVVYGVVLTGAAV